MLTQATQWMEVFGTAVDVFLLCRILFLRLHRVYLFITLGCVLALLFDATTLLLKNDTQGDFRVFLYSRFLYAVVDPLIAWDVFEEMKARVSKLRRLAALRLVSGLFFAFIFGLIMGTVFEGNDSGADSPLLVTMALVLWAGATTAALFFLITMHRVIRSQSLVLPSNTNVWLLFFELSFGAETLYCFATVLLPGGRPAWVGDALGIAFTAFGMAISGWCIWRLRAIPSGAPTAPENARLS